MSVTNRVTSTLVSPPAKTQKVLLRLHPFRALTSISMFPSEKNQKYPESSPSLTAWPKPVPSAVFQEARSLNLSESRQRVVAFGMQPGVIFPTDPKRSVNQRF